MRLRSTWGYLAAVVAIVWAKREPSASRQEGDECEEPEPGEGARGGLHVFASPGMAKQPLSMIRDWRTLPCDGRCTGIGIPHF